MKNLRMLLRIFLQKIRIWILVIAGVVILIQVLFFNVIDDLTILITTALLIMGVYLNKLNETALIKIGLFLVAFCPLFLVFKQDFIAEKVAIWAYIFLFLGVVKKLIIFLKRNGQNKKNI